MTTNLFLQIETLDPQLLFREPTMACPDTRTTLLSTLVIWTLSKITNIVVGSLCYSRPL